MVWEVFGKWFSDALTVVKVNKDEIEWQVNVLKSAQEAILARTKEAAPQQYEKSKKANEGNGAAYPEGFFIGVKVMDPVKLPLRVRVRLTDNVKNTPELEASMEAVITKEGKFVVEEYKLGSRYLWNDGNYPGEW